MAQSSNWGGDKFGVLEAGMTVDTSDHLRAGTYLIRLILMVCGILGALSLMDIAKTLRIVAHLQ